ncbi:MAG: hypothetical protein WBO28_14585 [Flavobacteriales bacterium]
MKTTISTFKPKASYPEEAIVVIFDLEGFSKFFSQPDVQYYVPKFINLVMEAFQICIDGGEAYWLLDKDGKPEKYTPLPKHIHSKFLGDGALFLWSYKSLKHNQIVALVNRLYNLKLNFSHVIERATEIVPVVDIPKNIRFGIAAGSVYKLTYLNSNKEEYIGYSINLASRLQNYCRDVGFIFSGRLNMKSKELESYLYKKLAAKQLKGFPTEIVIVDKDDYESLSDDIKKDLFDEL